MSALQGNTRISQGLASSSGATQGLTTQLRVATRAIPHLFKTRHHRTASNYYGIIVLLRCTGTVFDDADMFSVESVDFHTSIVSRSANSTLGSRHEVDDATTWNSPRFPYSMSEYLLTTIPQLQGQPSDHSFYHRVSMTQSTGIPLSEIDVTMRYS